MVLCLMFGCSSRTRRDKEVRFFRVPSVVTNQGEQQEELTAERRMRWISAISRENLSDKILENDRVCSRHFVSGSPAALWDKHNTDWVPTLHLGHSKSRSVDHEARVPRAKRAAEIQEQEAQEKKKRISDPGEPISSVDFDVPVAEVDEEPVDDTIECEITHRDQSTQTEDHAQIADKDSQTEEFTYLFERPESVLPFEETDFVGNDEKVRFYTGLSCYDVLMKTFNHVAPGVSCRSLTLSKFQDVVMVLMKLRLNMPFQDLAYRFRPHVSSVSRIFTTWMVIMDARLSPLISWPDRESLWLTMPQCFQFSFGKKTTVIIDCFEVFIDRPSNLLARAQTFSSYKHHNTIKVLIGITPQGTISFVSEAWGGRTSDKFLTENCGFLDALLPGDMVMADRGFTIHESLMFKQAKLVIPAFTKGKDQLDPIDVERTRGIANVRIHVERVIGLLRRKYTILEGNVPTELLTCDPGSTTLNTRVPMINRILRVCSALVNLCPPIIPFD